MNRAGKNNKGNLRAARAALLLSMHGLRWVDGGVTYRPDRSAGDLLTVELRCCAGTVGFALAFALSGYNTAQIPVPTAGGTHVL